MQQLMVVGKELIETDWRQQPFVKDVLQTINRFVPQEQWEEWTSSPDGAANGVARVIVDRTIAIVVNIGQFIVGLCIVLLGVYFFLAEGPVLIKTIQRVSPFKSEDEMELFKEFDRVCRAVILASVVTALAQAILAGIGFAVLRVPNVFLLAGLTMFTSMIPFVGAAFVWICVTIWLATQGKYVSATIMAVYGTVVISTFDNIIRAYVIHGKAKLHPLIALISVLGAIQTIGLWGIFVGPLVAAFFYTLLKILHQRIRVLDGASELIKPDEMTRPDELPSGAS
jgi:predicted PurR-regulated permease PerM